MTQESRLKRLEAASGGNANVIIAQVPADWDEVENKESIDRLIAENGLPSEWKVDLTKDANALKAKLIFAGNLLELFKYVAANSLRIGVATREAHK